MKIADKRQNTLNLSNQRKTLILQQSVPHSDAYRWRQVTN